MGLFLKRTIFRSPSVAHRIKHGVFVFFWMHAAWASAHTSMACPSVQATYLQSPPPTSRLSLVVLQNALVILELIPPNHTKSHRVTFQTLSARSELSEACEITPIALVQGGDWGWHVLWQTTKGIFYARVDGEAWVSSVPKRLAEHGLDVRMTLDQATLTVEWKTVRHPEQTQRAVSLDEGRSWH